MNVGKTVRLGLLGRNYNMTVDLPAPQWLLDLAAVCADSTVDKAELRVLECPELPELARPPWPKADLDSCIRLADRLNMLTDWEVTALRAVFVNNYPDTIEDVVRMTHGLGNVPVVRNVGSDYQLGQFVLDNDLNDDVSKLPEELLDCLDLGQLGRLQRKMDDGVFVDGDYVAAGQYEAPVMEESQTEEGGMELC